MHANITELNVKTATTMYAQALGAHLLPLLHGEQVQYPRLWYLAA